MATSCYYPDNFRRGIPGSPERGSQILARHKFGTLASPSRANSQVTEDKENLLKIAAIIRTAGNDIAPLIDRLHFANVAIEGKFGMSALDAARNLPAIADEIECDDVEYAEKAAESV